MRSCRQASSNSHAIGRILSAGILLLTYGLPALLAGIGLDPGAVDPLVYKNWFWWGPDMVADGNALLPMLTGLEARSLRLANWHFWSWMAGTVVMAFSMGLAGIQGMLRRTIYTTGLYRPHMWVALVGGVLLIVGLAAFVANLVVTLGLRNVLELFLSRRRAPQPA